MDKSDHCLGSILLLKFGGVLNSKWMGGALKVSVLAPLVILFRFGLAILFLLAVADTA